MGLGRRQGVGHRGGVITGGGGADGEGCARQRWRHAADVWATFVRERGKEGTGWLRVGLRPAGRWLLLGLARFFSPLFFVLFFSLFYHIQTSISFDFENQICSNQLH